MAEEHNEDFSDWLLKKTQELSSLSPKDLELAGIAAEQKAHDALFIKDPKEVVAEAGLHKHSPIKAIQEVLLRLKELRCSIQEASNLLTKVGIGNEIREYNITYTFEKEQKGYEKISGWSNRLQPIGQPEKLPVLMFRGLEIVTGAMIVDGMVWVMPVHK